MFVDEASKNPRIYLLKGASLGQPPALLANIRLGWTALPLINPQAYYKNSKL
jgi:hypothetical protein